ncbi:MAG TPA: DUF3842 family protein [Nitrospira sp.]|nr:DUF3842 family protein [Nitrospira sp.]
MRVCVIDGRGGGLGSRLVAALHADLADSHQVIGLGTNAVAASAMREAGAAEIGAGSRAMLEILPTVDVILTSLSLLVPTTMPGEVTPGMIRAIIGSRAKKVLLPINRAHVEVVGTETLKLEHLILRSIDRVKALLDAGSIA